MPLQGFNQIADASGRHVECKRQPKERHDDRRESQVGRPAVVNKLASVRVERRHHGAVSAQQIAMMSRKAAQHRLVGHRFHRTTSGRSQRNGHVRRPHRQGDPLAVVTGQRLEPAHLQEVICRLRDSSG